MLPMVTCHANFTVLFSIFTQICNCIFLSMSIEYIRDISQVPDVLVVCVVVFGLVFIV